MLEGIAFVLTLAGFASVVTVLWVLGSGDKLSSSEVFQTFTNDGGWSSLGLSMVAGQILLVWALTGQLPSLIPVLNESHMLMIIQDRMRQPIWRKKLGTHP